MSTLPDVPDTKEGSGKGEAPKDESAGAFTLGIW